jgi:hypothetical protein
MSEVKDTIPYSLKCDNARVVPSFSVMAKIVASTSGKQTGGWMLGKGKEESKNGFP